MQTFECENKMNIQIIKVQYKVTKRVITERKSLDNMVMTEVDIDKIIQKI